MLLVLGITTSVPQYIMCPNIHNGLPLILCSTGSWVNIEEGRGERSAYCVRMNVRALVMFCGIVRFIITLRNNFMCNLRELFGDRFEHFDSLDSFEKTSFVLGIEDGFSCMLDLVKDYIIDVWKLRKARLYDEILSVPQSQCQNSSGELRDVGDGGRLRCLHGKVDITISLCVQVVFSPPTVLGVWSMALVLWLPFECYY